MITTEELYIIRDGEKQKVDLSSPSGITLSYESNLFNSIDKVNCSHSYTVKLPKTVNNTRIFYIPQDVRIVTDAPRLKAGCEYLVDGVPMFKNGNAYVINVDTTINIVITWDVIEGLKKVADDNFNINEFDLKEGVETGMVSQKTYLSFSDNISDVYDNLEPCYRPFYMCGHTLMYGERTRAATVHTYPLPVVPVPYLIRRIENYYGIKLNIYTQQVSDGSGLTHVGNTDKAIDFGVIPCVSTKVKFKQNQKNLVKMSGIYCDGDGHKFTPNSLFDSGKRAFFFSKFNYLDLDSTEKEYDAFNAGAYVGGFASLCFFINTWFMKDSEEARIGFHNNRSSKSTNVRGYVKAWFHDDDLEHDDVGIAVNPSIEFYRNNHSRNPKDDPEQITSVEGIKTEEWKYVNGELCDCYEFIFDPEIGGSYVQIDTHVADRDCFPVFSADPSEISPDAYMEIIPGWEEGDYPHKQDIIGNLPEVTVLDFLKSLFFIVGGYPSIDANGEIAIQTYDEIAKKIPYAYDWSNTINEDELIEFNINSFKRKNYYLLANDEDKEDKYDPFDDEHKQEDVYESGKGCIKIENDKDDTKVIVTKLPWYGAFIKNGDNPRAETGNTMKYWQNKLEENKYFLTAKEAKPMYGVLEYDLIPDRMSHPNDDWYGIVMKHWNGFKDITVGGGYEWLAKLLKNPVVLKVNKNISLFDLQNLDMTRPVYIDEYNSYFCIIKVERSSDGICKSELLRIPPEAL